MPFVNEIKIVEHVNMCVLISSRLMVTMCQHCEDRDSRKLLDCLVSCILSKWDCICRG